MWQGWFTAVLLWLSLKNTDGLESGSKLLRLSCEVKESNGDITKIPCGCEKEKSVPCDIGPITAQGKKGALSMKFCNVSPNWTNPEPYGGIFHRACLIKEDVATSPKIFQTYTCARAAGRLVPCTLGPIKLVINGTKALAYLCNRMENHKIDENNIPKNSKCVSITQTLSSGRGHGSSHKSGKNQGGTGIGLQRPNLRPPAYSPYFKPSQSASSRGRIGGTKTEPTAARGKQNKFNGVYIPGSLEKVPVSGKPTKPGKVLETNGKNKERVFISSSSAKYYPQKPLTGSQETGISGLSDIKNDKQSNLSNNLAGKISEPPSASTSSGKVSNGKTTGSRPTRQKRHDQERVRSTGRDRRNARG